MPQVRHVGALDAAGHALVITQPMPPLRRGTVRVEVHASLISPGTELGGVAQARRSSSATAGDARPFGYQNAGVVLKCGPGAEEFKPGDRVACMGAGYAQHADFAVVPIKLCARLPDNVSFEEGAFAHLAMTALHAVRRGEPQPRRIPARRRAWARWPVVGAIRPVGRHVRHGVGQDSVPLRGRPSLGN